MAKNAFVAQVTFNVIFTALQKLNNVTYFTLQTVSIAFLFIKQHYKPR